MIDIDLELVIRIWYTGTITSITTEVTSRWCGMWGKCLMRLRNLSKEPLRKN